ncbi:MAG: trimeric intracellular cation channel family protein [Neisseriaceae bacterium]|nr:trimeric intracellular cation channel family protein [Neisseriaceae bacterium]
MEIALYIIEIIGTIAFAVIGAMIAIDKGFDIFGIAVLGVTTALGGGLIRDLIIGRIPPNMFIHPSYLLVSLITCAVVFLWIWWRKEIYLHRRQVIENVFNILDAVGLAVFAVIGVMSAWHRGFDNGFLCVFVGLCTACGGGIVRDVIANDVPMIFHSHVYAIAAIIGSLICYLMIHYHIHEYIAITVGGAAVFFIRIFAIKYQWNLPSIRLKE